MGQGVAEVLTFAIGVSISAMAIIAVILMLFSQRAKVNGLSFLAAGRSRWQSSVRMTSWLAIHNAAVMIVLLVVFGVDLIAKGLPPLTS